jgi:uncharacterized membrane protein
MLVLFVLAALVLSTETAYEKMGSLFLRVAANDGYALGKVLAVTEETQGSGYDQFWEQTVSLRLLSGGMRGDETVIHYRGPTNANYSPKKIQPGETIILKKSPASAGDAYYFGERSRFPAYLFITLAFIAIVIFFGRLRGLGSLLGLTINLGVLTLFVIPRIISGSDPVMTAFLGSVGIVLTSLYLAHGFNRRTTIALIGTLITLALAIVLSVIFVSVLHLTGLTAEDSLKELRSLLYTNHGNGAFDWHGFLLAGIIISMLGILDDATMSQSATVYEIKKAGPGLPFGELYSRGMAVGKEHIASLINTLVLVYAGAAFPLFLLIILWNEALPIWVILNKEIFAEEFVRTVVGSMALVLAIPITTAIAAYYVGEETAEVPARRQVPQDV